MRLGPWPYGGLEGSLRRSFSKVDVVRDEHRTHYLVRDGMRRGYAVHAFPLSARPRTLRVTLTAYSPIAMFVEKAVSVVAAASALAVVGFAIYRAATAPTPPSAWIALLVPLLALLLYFGVLLLGRALRRVVEALFLRLRADSSEREAAERLRRGLGGSGDLLPPRSGPARAC